MRIEAQWYGDCANTYEEERKQIVYAKRLGLPVSPMGAHPSYDLQGRSVVDVGGGPVSLLLKTINRGRAVVVDPSEFPDWVIRRYEQCGIEFWSMEAESESFTGYTFDEAWIYNVLQHVSDPEKAISNALQIAGVVRLFEWVDLDPYPGHPHRLTVAALEGWLGATGYAVNMNEDGAVGRAFYGVFAGTS